MVFRYIVWIDEIVIIFVGLKRALKKIIRPGVMPVKQIAGFINSVIK